MVRAEHLYRGVYVQMARKKQSEKSTEGALVDLATLVPGVAKFSDENEAVITDFLPTGLPNIDFIIGGGIPAGRLTEVYGVNGSGKCLVKETRVLTTEGYKTVEQVFNEEGYEAVNTTKVVPAHKTVLINRYGKPEKVNFLTFNGKRPVYHVTTRTGLEQRITARHPLLVIRDGIQSWRRAEELQVGDQLVTRRGDDIYGNNSLSFDEAYALGALIADGYHGEKYVGFTNNQPAVLARVKAQVVAWSLSNNEPKQYLKQGTNSYSFKMNKQTTESYYKLFNICPGVAKDKVVPDKVLTANKKTQLAFLSGYIESEGSMDITRGLEVTTASPVLLAQVQLMLKNMGIIAMRKDKKVKGYEHNKYERLAISGVDVGRLLPLLTFVTEQRNAQKSELLNHMSDTQRLSSTNHDTIHLGNLVNHYLDSVSPSNKGSKSLGGHDRSREYFTRPFLTKLFDGGHGEHRIPELIAEVIDPHYYYDTITSIELLEAEPTFDFTLEETHSFIAESIVNHNSTLATLVTKVVQDMDIDVVWIDVEGTLETRRLVQLGLDPSKNLYLVKPPKPKGTKTSETDGRLSVEEVGIQLQALIEGSTQSGRRMLIVWDSVGATPAKAQFEQGMEGKQMGVHAKAVTNLATLIGQDITNSSVALIAINQARDKIGAYVPTIDSGGGNAFKHWASLRLQINKGSADVETKLNAYGNAENIKTRYTGAVLVKKSKISIPNRKEEFVLVPETGINLGVNYFELLSKPSKYGLLTRAGAYYQYVMDNGTQASFQKDEWVRILDKPEGDQEVELMQELIQKMYMISFPEWYPALDNEVVDIERNIIFTGLRARYEAKNASQPLTEPEPTE